MSTPSPLLSFRPATIDDVPLIRQLIAELADYEKLAHAAVATDDDLRVQLFGAHPAADGGPEGRLRTHDDNPPLGRGSGGHPGPGVRPRRGPG